MFSSNTNSLGYQSFKGVSWALNLGLPLRDTIKGLLLVLSPFLISTFGLTSWAYASIISNPISSLGNVSTCLIQPKIHLQNKVSKD